VALQAALLFNMSKAHFPEKREKRSSAEWISLAISSIIVLALFALVIFHRVSSGDAPATLALKALTGSVRQVDQSFYLPIEVTNKGAKTAEGVRVEGRQQNEIKSFEIDFLDGEESAAGVLIFSQDPRIHPTTVSVVSFREP
jgi:uncharacterized protein (TIGR02588 family)